MTDTPLGAVRQYIDAFNNGDAQKVIVSGGIGLSY